jgi:hypothetical protein
LPAGDDADAGAAATARAAGPAALTGAFTAAGGLCIIILTVPVT